VTWAFSNLPVLLAGLALLVEVVRSEKVRKIIKEIFANPRVTSVLRRDKRSGELKVTVEDTPAHAH